MSPAKLRPRGARVALAACVALLLSACAHKAETYRWADELPDEPHQSDPSYVIAPGDVLGVRVWSQEGMTSRAKVRADGRISLPLVGEVEAAGRTPAQLTAEVRARLKAFVNEPDVTVAVEETRPFSVGVVGEVTHPGVYPLEPGAGVLDALATAGGLTEYAGSDRIFVVRRTGTRQRLRFRYRDLAQGDGRSATFQLRPGDMVVVE